MRAIDADAFDERVRAAGGMSEEELTEDFKDGVQAVLYMLSNQPTIQPEPHWIPVTEEPKKEEKSYWVCLEDGGQCQCRWTNDVYGIGANAWSKWGWKKVDLPQFSKVVAYMPLPEPYKEVTT